MNLTRKGQMGTEVYVVIAVIITAIVAGVAGYFLAPDEGVPQAEFDELESDFEELEQDYQDLQEEQGVPLEDYEELESERDELQTQADDLQSQLDAFEDPWMGDRFSAPRDPGWHQWERVHPPYKIGIAIAWSGNPWRLTQEEETDRMMEALEEMGWVEEWRRTNAGADVSEQKEQLEQLEDWGADAIILDPVAADPMIEDIQRLHNNGIFTAINVEAPHPENLENQFGTIFQTNYYKSGYEQGKFVAEQLENNYPEDQRKVAILQGYPGAPSAVERYDGAVHAIDEYDSVEIVAEPHSEWSPDKAREDAADILTANPNVRGWVTQGSQMMSSIPPAIEEAGQDPGDHVMTGEDFVSNLDLQEEHGFEMLMAGNPQSQQTFAVWRAIQGLQGVPVRRVDYFDPPVLSTEELDQIYIDGLPGSAQLMSLLTEDQLKELLE